MEEELEEIMEENLSADIWAEMFPNSEGELEYVMGCNVRAERV